MRFVKRQEKKIIEKWGNKNEFLKQLKRANTLFLLL